MYWRINIAKLKYINNPTTSVVVVINGDEIVAGSIFSFAATIGSIPPIIHARKTMISKADDNNTEITSFPVKKNPNRKITGVRVKPNVNEVIASFSKTFSAS